MIGLLIDDERAIAVVIRYATAIDRRDWSQMRRCFTEDARADYPGFGLWRGVEEITATMEQLHLGIGPTLHRITNIAVENGPDGVTVRSYVDAILMPLAAKGAVNRASGYYDDVVVRTPEWRIAERRFTMVWMREVAE